MATETAVINFLRASRPSFRNADDKIAFAVHAAFFAAGYSLIATGAKAFPENPPTDGEEVGLDGWNELEDAYAFVYTKTANGVKKAVLVKCLSVGNELAVDVLNLTAREGEPKEPLHVQINIRNHLEDGGDGPVKYGEMYKDLKGLLENLNEGVFSKLEPAENASPTGEGSSASRGDEGSGFAQPDVHFGYQPDPSRRKLMTWSQQLATNRLLLYKTTLPLLPFPLPPSPPCLVPLPSRPPLSLTFSLVLPLLSRHPAVSLSFVLFSVEILVLFFFCRSLNPLNGRNGIWHQTFHTESIGR